MSKLSLSIALCAVLVCLSTAQSLNLTAAQTRRCPQQCRNVAFRCTPYQREPVFSIVDGFCRVFQNGCIFGSENCYRVNSCRNELVSITREECRRRCNQICALEGIRVCATFADTDKEGNPISITRTFINRCLLDKYSCKNGIAYIGEPTKGECQ